MWWEVENEWNGRWRTRDGWLYPDNNEDDANILEELQLEGAFSTPGINRHFRSERCVLDYFIYRRTRAMTIRWHPRLGFWRLGDEYQLGDIENLRAPLADRPRTVPSSATEAQLETQREVQHSTQLALDQRRRAVIALQG